MLIGMPVTVVGAGVAGLATALALARRGAVVRVVEQAQETGGQGAGLQISPNGASALSALGLAGELLSNGLVGEAVTLRDFRRGRAVLRLDLRRRQAGQRPFVLIHRTRLIALLLDAARDAGVEIDFGKRVLDYEAPQGGVLVGADGLHSGLGGLLNDRGAPQFTGHAAWRAVIEDDAPPGAPEVQVFMGPGRHLVTYPLAGGLRNIVAVEERDSWTHETRVLEGDSAAIRAAFAGFAPEVGDWLARAERVCLWGLFLHPLAGRWHDETRVLVGDAAHPTLPFLAQGANLALEDAWMLADCLAARPPSEAFALYRARRWSRAARAVAAANANGRNYHLRHPIMRASAHAVLRIAGLVVPGAVLRRYSWLYNYDVTMG